MYRLLIVDDEIENVQWLKELFQYECEVEFDVYTAYSGRKALELLNEVRMDVVLTDIKMPGMDGVELYHHIKENWPNARVVFLTGYRDYEVLYEIVKNGEVRYILKTEGDEIIRDAVIEAVHELEKAEREKAEGRASDYSGESEVLAAKEFWNNLTQGITAKVEQRQLDELGISMKAEYPLLCYLGRIRMKEKENGSIYQKQALLLERLEESMPKIVRMFGCFMENSYIMLLIQPKITDDNIDWKRIFHISSGALEYALESGEQENDMVETFAVSGQPVDLSELSEQYEKLKRCMIRTQPKEGTAILNLEDAEKKGYKKFDNGNIMLRISQLELLLEQREAEAYFKLLTKLTDPLRVVNSIHSPEALVVYYNISVILLKYINVNQLNEDIPFEIAVYKLTNVEEHENWENAVSYLFQISRILFRLAGERDNFRTDTAVRKVQKYIKENLEKELTLTALAEVGGFNASYLSRIFKQCTHMNLSEYIVKERMQKAKELLTESTQKVNIIAESVGYYSQHSFNRVFKTSEGMTPLEYRNKYKNG